MKYNYIEIQKQAHHNLLKQLNIYGDLGYRVISNDDHTIIMERETNKFSEMLEKKQ